MIMPLEAITTQLIAAMMTRMTITTQPSSVTLRRMVAKYDSPPDFLLTVLAIDQSSVASAI